MLLAVSAVSIMMTFDLFPRAENHIYSFYFAYNEGAVETVSMFTRFICTPLIFLCKSIVKSILYKGRTVIIKVPLVRHVMAKGKVRGFLGQHEESRYRRKSSFAFDQAESTEEKRAKSARKKSISLNKIGSFGK